MQNLFAVFVALGLVAVAVALPQESRRVSEARERLSPEHRAAFDYVVAHKDRVDEFLTDTDRIGKIIDCVLSKAECEDDLAKNIKILIPYALEDRCESCTRKERGIVIKFAKVVKNQLPERYQELLAEFNDGEEPPELAEL